MRAHRLAVCSVEVLTEPDAISGSAQEARQRRPARHVSWTSERERERDQFPRGEQQQRDDDCQHPVTEDPPAPARHQSNRSFVGIGGHSFRFGANVDALAAALGAALERRHLDIRQG